MSKKRPVLLVGPRPDASRESFKKGVREALREKGLLKAPEVPDQRPQTRHHGPDSPA